MLAALAHGFEQREVESSKPTHKIRVDFKVGHELTVCFYLIYINNVWHFHQRTVMGKKACLFVVCPVIPNWNAA